MGILKLTVLLVVFVAVFSGFLSSGGVEALTCRCIFDADRNPDCKDGIEKCEEKTDWCYKNTTTTKNGSGPAHVSLDQGCKEGKYWAAIPLPAKGQACTIHHLSKNPVITSARCFCDTDDCITEDANGNGIIIHSWSWISVLIFASVAITVSIFIGGQ